MDPQLTKQLNRRRLLLENSLDTLTEYENKVKKIETTSKLTTDIVPSDYIKNNFLEKIKKFESFGDNQTKVTQQNNVDKVRSNTELVSKSNNFNSDVILKKTPVTSKLELNTTKDSFVNEKRNQKNRPEKIKQVVSLYVLENKIVKENTNNLHSDERPQTSSDSTKTLKIKSCSKSDYNNWKLDKKWVFFTEYPSLINNKTSLFASKILKEKKKSTGIIQNTGTIFSKN